MAEINKTTGMEGCTSAMATLDSAVAPASRVRGAHPGPTHGPLPTAHCPNDLLLFAGFVHRALHGRYTRVMVLATLCAVLFAGLAAMRSRPVFRSEGIVRHAAVLPHALEQTDQNAQIANFDAYMQGQRAAITSHEMIARAMGRPVWQQTGSSLDAGRFAARLKVDLRSRTDFLRIAFDHPDPAIAAAAVRATIEAYEEAFAQQQFERERQRLEVLEAVRVAVQRKLLAAEAQVRELAEAHGSTELGPLYSAGVQRASRLEMLLAEVRHAIARSDGELMSRENHSPSHQLTDPPITPLSPLTPTRIARIDPTMRRHLEDRLRVEQSIEWARSRGYGDAHPEILHWQNALASSNRRIDELAAEYNAELTQALAGESSRSLDALRAEERQLAARLADAQAHVTGIGRGRMELEQAQAEVNQHRRALADLNRRIGVLEAEGMLAERMSVISYGDLPTRPLTDRRTRAAMTAAAMGALMIIGLFVLDGARRPRYRLAKAAKSNLAAYAPIFAAVPRLAPASPRSRTLTSALCRGERESEECGPASGPAAAHVIHDLRLTLSVNAAGAGGRSVYLVTSAAGGEGKTSLALALGLSFAAARTRTLLIDFDLERRGLTCGYAAEQVDGLHEVLAGGSLSERIRRTRGGLSILFAGRCGRHDASTLNLARVRQVLADARREYDVILLDGGPVTATTEAALLAGAVDGVLLTVAQDQDQRQVHAAIARITEMGAAIAAVVFNKALPETPPMARPAAAAEAEARQTGGTICRFGPLAEALVLTLPDLNAAETEASGDGSFPRNAFSERRRTDRATHAA